MARQRRGGFRPPELRGTLGTLLRTTLAQAGGLRDALERGAREGRARIDDALSGRRRNDALIELGEVVLDLIRRGEIEIDQLPEARELVAHLDELDHSDEEAADYAPAPSRSRFDDRGRDDGTVSSGGPRWVPPKKSAAPARIWRPVEESDRPVDHVPPPAPPKKLGGITFGKNDDDNDDDLADYMHPDDVPPKAT
ncbi:MAG: hypothetical protein ABI591_26565 [Kofleriaceae bacterium]